MGYLAMFVVLASCASSTDPPAIGSATPPAPPAPVARPPKLGEAMEILELACPTAKGVDSASVEAALRQRSRGIRTCFERSATATVELGADGVRSIETATPAVAACLGHALRHVRIPDNLVGATCTIGYQLTR